MKSLVVFWMVVLMKLLVIKPDTLLSVNCQTECFCSFLTLFGCSIVSSIIMKISENLPEAAMQARALTSRTVWFLTQTTDV